MQGNGCNGWNTTGDVSVATHMATATINGVVIAESDDTVVVEGNHYFPISSVIDGVLVTESNRDTYFEVGDFAYVVFEEPAP